VNDPTACERNELALFQNDRPAWVALAAPRIAARIVTMDNAQIDYCWQTMLHDLRKKVWTLLDDPQKARVRAVRPIDTQSVTQAA
jgi:hypothetical protein